MKNVANTSSNLESTKKRCRGARDHAPELVALRDRIAAVVALGPLSIDEAPLRLLLGDPKPLRTLRDVASAFGRERNTVQTSWRGGGMPGSGGNYDPVTILCWLLRRETKRNSPGGTVNGYHDEDRRELANIELEEARLDLAIKRSRADRVAGEYVAVALARSEFCHAMSIVRDGVMSVGRNSQPFLPQQHAIEIREHIDRQCERALNQAADILETFCDDARDSFKNNGSNDEKRHD